MLQDPKPKMKTHTEDDAATELGHSQSANEGVLCNTTSDAVFGDITEKGPNYRNVSFQCP